MILGIGKAIVKNPKNIMGSLFVNIRCYSVNPLLESNTYYCDSPEMVESIRRRNMTLDLSSIDNLSKRYKQLKDEKNKIEATRIRISETLTQLKDKTDNEEEVSGLNNAAKILRNDLKELKNVIHDLEKQLSPLLLKLPNLIDEKTLDTEHEVYTSPCDEKESDSHINIGKRLGVLEFFLPTSYFFKKDVASFEISVLTYFSKILSESNYTPISNPDFCRDVMREISGDSMLSLGKYTDNDFLYLHGGASHIPFLSFFQKTVLKVDYLPLRLFTQGRNYNLNESKDEGLYSVPQSSAIQIFTIASEETVSSEFDNVVNTVKSIYQSLEVPFRIIYSPASSLLPSESLRADFEVYSAYQKKFKRVGNISLYTDYFSQRSNIFYSKDSVNFYVHIISGTVVKIPPLVAGFLEFKQNCELPKIIQSCQI